MIAVVAGGVIINSPLAFTLIVLGGQFDGIMNSNLLSVPEHGTFIKVPSSWCISSQVLPSCKSINSAGKKWCKKM